MLGRLYVLFGLESLDEVLTTIRRNRLRTFLTGLSVAWGMFMLAVLLGAGRGLEHGVEWEFRDDAVNSVWLFANKTSKPYAGRAENRDVRFMNDDYEAVQRDVPGVEHLAGRFHLWGEFAVSYKDKSSAFDIRGVHPAHRYLEKTLITQGRFLNDQDLKQRRKVAVIGERVQEILFGAEVPLGKFIQIRGLSYQVVGVFQDVGGEGEVRKVYVPITTAQLVYNQPGRIHYLMFTVAGTDVTHSQAVAEQARQLLAVRHDVAPDDKRAIRVQNNLERFAKLTSVFDWLGGFVWFVGAGTLLAGMVGVGNIMLISVTERTREIGIRKALGATPGSIVRMVLFEALLITAVSGYAGLVAGVGVIELVAQKAPAMPFFRNPEVNLGVMLIATLMIVLAGLLAGWVPARRAARVNPIEALRDG
ncbi:MAG TPA: ABC transporter permease [Polyangiaceae bacterium]|nr:ABC transporter permease [Polyangiaceae bacterium]